MAKRYYWLKLKDDFFNQKEIKKLRRIAGGDTYVIIYLKLQLLSIKKGGELLYEGFEDSFAEEMALTIDEAVDNVKITLMFLEKHGLLQCLDKETYNLTRVKDCIGLESESAERVRRHREKKKLEAEKEVKALQCNVTESYSNVSGNVEKRREEKIREEKIDLVLEILKKENVIDLKKKVERSQELDLMSIEELKNIKTIDN